MKSYMETVFAQVVMSITDAYCIGRGLENSVEWRRLVEIAL